MPDRPRDPAGGCRPGSRAQIDLYEEGRESGTYLFYVQESSQVQTQEVSEQELEGVAAGATLVVDHLLLLLLLR